MKIRRLLKFAFSALLLSASVTAYGQEVVKLKNGTTTWENYVGVINGTITLPGSVDENSDVAKELARTKGIWEQKDADLTDSIAATNNAQTALTNANDSVTDLTPQYSLLNGEASDLKSKLADFRSQLALLNSSSSTTTDGWLSKIITAANNFKNSRSSNNVTIWYKSVTDPDYGDVLLYVAFEDPGSALGGSWGSGTYSVFNAFLKTVGDVYQIDVYLGESATAQKDDNYCVTINYVGTAIGSIATQSYNAVNGLKTDYQVDSNADKKQALNDSITATEKAYDEKAEAASKVKSTLERITKSLPTLRAAVTKAQADEAGARNSLAAAKEDMDEAQEAYDKALADSAAAGLDNYKEVTLTADVTANTRIGNNFGEDYVLNGNNHIITLGQGVQSLFNAPSGLVTDLAVNGRLAMSPGGLAGSNVVYWRNNGGDNWIGRHYDEDGDYKDYTNLAELAYQMRDINGADFDNNTFTSVADNSASKIFSVSIYETATAGNPYYVQIANGALNSYASGAVTIPTNRFAGCADSDAAGRNVVNMFYPNADKNAYIAENVVITDQVKDGNLNVADFLCPVDLTAANVTYNRALKAESDSWNSLCLPFEVSYDMLNMSEEDETDAICTYNRETTEKFWFTKVAGPVAANTPLLIVSKNGATMKTFENVALKATPADQWTIKTAEDGSQNYGLLKRVTVQQIAGDNGQTFKVYGLSGKKYQIAGSNASFAAFRMALRSNATSQANAPQLRSIGIMNEYGVDITDRVTGVKDIQVDLLSFDIVGGVGEISFTADSDFGKVEIYSIEGKLATVAEVVAGTTSVELPSGVYVVMGKKVLVK